MRIFISLLFFLCFFPHALVYAQESNAGFVQGLWYSKEQIFAGESVRIYVAIRNNTEGDLSGTVEFFDGERRIDRKNVQALSGRIIESWADWSPEYATRTLKATLSRTELHNVGSSTQSVVVVSALAQDTFFVDYDTDSDGVGNREDTDDDGDTISDTQEKTNGTNPLQKNTVVEEKSSEKDTSEEDDTDTSQESDNQDSNNNDQDGDGDDDTSEGLEQYLEPSRAESVLSGITEYVTKTKENLDTYREKRTERLGEKKASSTKPAVNKDGFGEITRTQEGDTKTETTKELARKGSGFFDTVVHAIGTLITTLYTLLLTALSFILAHPMFVQLGILILILFLLMKFASKFGRRPKNK